MSIQTRKMPRIGFIMPYFGAWPFWLPFFIESCRTNPSVDWLFYTDCPPISDCPPNVHIIPISYQAYCKRISTQLGITFDQPNPYKLCDIRPAFGYIHKDELHEYDFWAFGDIDLVWGNLRAYFTAERLAQKDLFSTHARRISGHCCLLRNVPHIREAFLRIPRWQERFTTPEHQALDEGAFSRRFIRHKSWPAPLARIANTFNPLNRRAEFIEAYSTPGAKIAWTDGQYRFPLRWYWRHGELTNDLDGKHTFPYFHFIVWKKNDWKTLTPPSTETLAALAASGAWQIDAQGFHPHNTHRL